MIKTEMKCTHFDCDASVDNVMNKKKTQTRLDAFLIRTEQISIGNVRCCTTDASVK